ncbi:MAG: hypothetical protein WCR06_08405 [bacterium]
MMKLRRWQKALLICLGVLLVPVVAIAIWLAMASRDIPAPDFSDLDGALADCLELLRFGDLQTRHAPTLIQYLASRFTLAMGLAASRELVASNRLNESSLLLLDTALRHVDAGTNGLPMAIRGEFQFCSGILRDLHAGRIPYDRMIDDSTTMYYLRKFGMPHFLIKPNETRLLFASGCRETIRNFRHLYRDMRFRDSDGELARAARRRLLWRGNAVGAILVATLLPSMESVNKQLCRGKCDLAGVRLLIALRRYERANGSLPDRLDDLVPGFIEAVPADPFDGQPLRYSSERRIIWAVGENLRDDGGSKRDSRTNAETENSRHMLDYVIAVPEL